MRGGGVARPDILALLAGAAGRAPIAGRLALRDLARYRARSGAALGAISISVLIAVIICVIAAARFGSAVDYVGPNLAPDQLVVYPAAVDAQRAGPAGAGHGTNRPLPGTSVLLHSGTGSFPTQVTRAQLATMTAQARRHRGLARVP